MEFRLFYTRVRLRWGHALALAGLVAAVVGYYFDYLTGKAFIWEDMVLWYYPALNYFCNAVASGRFPFWLPGLLNGMPLYTDFQTAVYYPFRWLLVLFVRDGALPVVVYQWYVVLHIIFGGVMMAGYLKSHRLGPLACWAGSVVFCLAGFPALHIIHNPMVKVYAWLPLQLWLVDKVVATRCAKYYAGLTAVIFLSFCAGFPQATLYDSYLVIAYWLYRRCCVRPVGSAWTIPAVSRWLASEGWRIAGVFGSVLLLSAVLILPTFEHWRLSTREAMGFVGSTEQSLPVRNLIQVAVPNFFGTSNCTPKDDNFWGSDPKSTRPQSGSGRPHYWEFGVYAGQLAWLAVLAVGCGWQSWRATPARFFAVGWGLALWFMLGRYGGLFTGLYHWLPGVALFRSPARMAGVADCCAAILVAWLVEAVTGSLQLRIGRAVAVGVGLYALAGSIGWVWGMRIYPELSAAALAAVAKAQIWTAGLLFVGLAGSLWGLRHPRRLWRWTSSGVFVGLLFFDLHQAYGFFHQGEVNPDTYYKTNHWIVEKYQAEVRQAGPIRFAQLEDGRFGQILQDRNIPLVEQNFETPQGNVDLMLQSTAQFRQLTNQTALLDLQNVGLAVSRTSDVEEIKGEVRRRTLPRVAFYAAVRNYNSDAAILRDLDRGALDYRRVMAVRADEFSSALPVFPEIAAGEVKLIRLSPEHYQIRYHTLTPGIIFVSESYYPGWEVQNETGQPFQLIHAFVAFKGIVVPHAGRGTLDVRFRPRSFRLGAAISCLTALALAIFYRWRSRWEWPLAPKYSSRTASHATR